ncbi:helix-turn-helix transcriptional regulator [Roseomonas terrae]|uniref:Helix-turn-helix transcriptional regulator n=1 Tax=Neoroseomonas terrae TaxID=424799 RepID=A0ABS5EET5_9PROT|nr:helix-turn-helix transcriptional regulator [Neoroseomonas terrae]MBR0649534.1 helix-turn-helix transcriptional regulator [Neoroseomonas terrae]
MADKSLSAEEIERNHRFAAPLRAWMKRSKHNQKYIAEQLNVSEPTVSKWLSGKQTMSVPTFMAIAGLLGARPEEALGGPEYRERAARYQKLSEIVARLSDEQLKALENIADQLAPARTDEI